MSSDSESDWEPEPTLNLKIVNVDKKEVKYLGDLLYESDYAAASFGDSCLSVFTSLEWKSLGQLMEKERINYRRSGVPRGLGQLEIPEELICMIFDRIDDVRIAFRLGAANTRLMIIGESRIKQLMDLANWTGDRFICVEDGGDDIDLPEGLVSGDTIGDFKPPAQRCTNKDIGEGLESDTPESRIAYELAVPVSIDTDVIWNHSKHVYVRADAIPGDISGREPDSRFIMGWFLLVHIIWTKSDVFSGGAWAGDRFEWTGKDVLETRLGLEDASGGRKWTDASEESFQFFRNSKIGKIVPGVDY